MLKPNRGYGGTGIAIGPATPAAQWEQLVYAALAPGGERWVAQRLVPLPVHQFPVMGADGRLHDQPFYVVFGFAPSPYGLATLGRASQAQIVNVAQRGGMCILVVGHPPGQIVEAGPPVHVGLLAQKAGSPVPRRKDGVRDQGRGQRFEGERIRLRPAKDHVRRQAHRRRRHDLHLRERERGRAGADRSRRRHLGEGNSEQARHPPADAARQHRRRRVALARRRLGRSELKPFVDWDAGRPETELNFKFYRQATNKIIGISDQAAAFLRGFF